MVQPVITYWLHALVALGLEAKECSRAAPFVRGLCSSAATVVFFAYKVVALNAIFFTPGVLPGIEDVLCAGGYFTKSVTYLNTYGSLFELPITLFLLTIVGLVAPAGLVRASRISIMRIAVFSAVAVPL